MTIHWEPKASGITSCMHSHISRLYTAPHAWPLFLRTHLVASQFKLKLTHFLLHPFLCLLGCFPLPTTIKTSLSHYNHTKHMLWPFLTIFTQGPCPNCPHPLQCHDLWFRFATFTTGIYGFSPPFCFPTSFWLSIVLHHSNPTFVREWDVWVIQHIRWCCPYNFLCAHILHQHMYIHTISRIIAWEGQ